MLTSYEILNQLLNSYFLMAIALKCISFQNKMESIISVLYCSYTKP